MGNLSITTAWNEGWEFFKREAGLILPIALLLIALPGALMQMAMPVTTPGQPPEGGLWLLILPVVIIAGMVGTIAITHLALRPGASVAEALQVGLRRFLPLLGASLLVALAITVVAVPVFLVVGGAAIMSGNAMAAGGSLLLVILIFVVALVAIWVRLMLMTPAAAAETVGPVAIIRRSWELTAGHFWKLLGFVLLLVIVALVISMVVGAIFGILLYAVVGPPDPGTLSMTLLTIVSSIIQAIFGAIFATVIARIYLQLSGGSAQAVFT